MLMPLEPTPPNRQNDEKRIVELLDQLHVLPENDPRRPKLEDELFRLVDKHFREALKPFLLSKFGPAAGKDGAARYTAMMNDFFIKVLASRPDAFWRAKSALELRKWVSRVVSNLMIDHLRREKRHEPITDAIAPLVDERKVFFREKTGLEFAAEVLEIVEGWCQGNDPGKKRRGLVLRHRYVDGMTRAQISEQLELTTHEVRKAHDEGIAALREEIGEV